MESNETIPRIHGQTNPLNREKVLILVGGGARSGKSKFAQQLALSLADQPLFLATGQPRDSEMEHRIKRHQELRSPQFQLVEEPIEIARVIKQYGPKTELILVDCLTLWLSNLLEQCPDEMEGRLNELLATLQTSMTHLILVTNETGCGIVPENPLGRQFRDLLGELNQRVASLANEVYWVIFGCTLRVK